MIVQRFTLPKYNWEVTAYYYVDCYYKDDIISKLESIKCKREYLEDATANLTESRLNTGLCYSNFSLRQTVLVIARTSSPEQFMNSYDHERMHLISHILQANNINPYSEEAAYLAGDIGQKMFKEVKKFMCSCHGIFK